MRRKMVVKKTPPVNGIETETENVKWQMENGKCEM